MGRWEGDFMNVTLAALLFPPNPHVDKHGLVL
jgi:hypothetical protein